MSEIVTAVYEGGILRPLTALNLREHQTVRIQVLPEKPIEAERIIQILVSAGLMHPPKRVVSLPPDPLSPEERRELARLLGQAPGKPLSEIVIEDRGER
jgi:predicted DNA-binding antitoxin AbrB/MazE fold protein